MKLSFTAPDLKKQLLLVKQKNTSRKGSKTQKFLTEVLTGGNKQATHW